MPLEPWEIELKKQLSGDEARYQPAPPKPEQPQPAPKQEAQAPKPSGDSGTLSFILTLLFLLAVTVFVYDHKTGGKLKSYVTSLFKSRVDDEKPKLKPERAEKQPAERQDQSAIKSEVDSIRKESQARIDELSAKLQKTTDKVKALGLLVNENFNIIGQNIPDEFMFLNRDWTLDRSPKYLELTPEDKEYLRKYVREN